MKKLAIALGILLIPLWVYLLFGFGLWLLGYELAGNPEFLARKLINQNRPARDCLLFRTLDLGPRPTTQELIASCIYKYAKISKDPTACELLLPSDYGWECLRAAEKPNARMCWFDFTSNYARGERDDEPRMPECGSGNDDFAVPCCDMARLLYLERVESCGAFVASEVLHDQCLEALARRDGNRDLCITIANPHVRTACEVAVDALLEPASSP